VGDEGSRSRGQFDRRDDGQVPEALSEHGGGACFHHHIWHVTLAQARAPACAGVTVSTENSLAVCIIANTPA
jgi:hypothetical protein